MPSWQGLSRLEQGAFIPLHSFALQDDMSVETLIGAMNPSLQKPPEHFWPLGQTLLAKQGSFADAPFQTPTYLLTGWNTFIKTNAKTNTTRVATTILPMSERSLNISSVEVLDFRDVPSKIKFKNYVFLNSIFSAMPFSTEGR